METQDSYVTSDYTSYGPETGVQPSCIPELVRRRAYELFEARGGQPGHELDDWLQAEREVKHHLL